MRKTLCSAAILMLLGLAIPAAPARAAAIIAPFPPAPFAPPGWACRWVPPTYRMVYERVWVTETWVDTPQWVEVAPGRFVQELTRLRVPGHWEQQSHQELAAAGYWELVRVVPRPMPMPRPIYTSAPPTVSVEGYRQGDRGEDLSVFSPLREWPH